MNPNSYICSKYSEMIDETHSIVRFYESTKEGCCCDVLPIMYGSDLAFRPNVSGSTFYITDMAGKRVTAGKAIAGEMVSLESYDLSTLFATGDCFRIEIGGRYSNLFKYIDCEDDNTTLFEYWDNASRRRIRLSAKLEAPQNKKEKSEYTNSNGKVISLSNTMRKEYQLGTDYLSAELHDLIGEMLLFPNIIIDDEMSVFESGSYDVDWGNPDADEKAKAKTALSLQSIKRYSVN